MSDLERMGVIESWDLLCHEVTGERIHLNGDCEDAALTIMEYFLRSGGPRNQIGVARVATEVCPKHHVYDHAVCVLLEGSQIIRVSDNRYLNYGLMPTGDLRHYRWYDLVTPDSFKEFQPAKRLDRK